MSNLFYSFLSLSLLISENLYKLKPTTIWGAKRKFQLLARMAGVNYSVFHCQYLNTQSPPSHLPTQIGKYRSFTAFASKDHSDISSSAPLEWSRSSSRATLCSLPRPSSSSNLSILELFPLEFEIA